MGINICHQHNEDNKRMTITIHNLRNEKPTEPWQVKICRGVSALGNPFYLGAEGERDEVCDKYSVWFKHRIENPSQHPAFSKTIQKLYSIMNQYGKLELFCWCSPLRCHAETIKEYLENSNA